MTGAFFPAIGSGRGAFATARVALDDDTGLTLGIAEDQLRDTYDGAGFAPDNWTHSAALRLDHDTGRSQLRFRARRRSSKTAACLGTLAAGGLKLSEQATTVWATRDIGNRAR